MPDRSEGTKFATCSNLMGMDMFAVPHAVGQRVERERDIAQSWV
jgi:hypothetical protein